MNDACRLVGGLLAGMFFLAGCVLQHPEQALSVKDDMAVLRVNLKATEHELDSIAEALSLQDLNLLAYVREGNDRYLRATGWKLVSHTEKQACWEKPLALMYGAVDPGAFLKTVVDYNTFYPKADFGINALPDRHVRSNKGQTTFFLRGHLQARRVILSGDFNQWTTTHQPMALTDSGWIATIPLQPGKHLYKFIVDGNWIHDPLNPLREDDTHDGWNSLYFVENYLFQLNRPEAKEVRLTGSFIHWKPEGVLMLRTASGWELPVFLTEGTHSYQFVVDGVPITDPANPLSRTLSNGRTVSLAGLGTVVIFRLNGFADARKVILAGSFNNWDEQNDLMHRTEKGWEVSLYLGAGMHEYKFIVDGKWMRDPVNPLIIGSVPMDNSVLMVKPNHTFVLKGFPEASSVRLTGDFMGWDPNGLVMQRTAAGWILPIWLSPGKASYCFIVDGHPIKDPGNPLWEEDGRPNSSVVWVGAKIRPESGD